MSLHVLSPISQDKPIKALKTKKTKNKCKVIHLFEMNGLEICKQNIFFKKNQHNALQHINV